MYAYKLRRQKTEDFDSTEIHTGRNLFLACMLTTMPVCAAAQQPSQPDQSTRQDGVVQRGDHVMVFSHDATTHHFHLLRDGGEIVVTANDPNDKTSIEQTRMHLGHIQYVLEWEFRCPDADSHQSSRCGDNDPSEVRYSVTP